MNYLDLIKNYEQNMLDDLFGLLRIPSTLEVCNNPLAPFGEQCKIALKYMLELGNKMGFVTKNIDNVAGHIEYGQGDKIIAMLCHVDVVPAVGQWTTPPYEPSIRDGKVYARGSIDDKGPAISALYALKMLKDSNFIPKCRIRLIIGTDEETGSRCLKRYFQKEAMPDFGFSPDADFPVIYGEKGIISFNFESKTEPLKWNITSGDRYNIVPDECTAKVPAEIVEAFKQFKKENKIKANVRKTSITTHGVAHHAMAPSKGVNAILPIAKCLKDYNSNLLTFIDKYLSDPSLTQAGLNYTHHEMGELTMNLAVLRIENGKGYCGINMRYPIDWDKKAFIETMKQYALPLNIKVVELGDSKPHYVNPNDKYVQTLYSSYKDITNDDTPMFTIGGGTYARMLKKGVAFGQVFPNEIDLAHQTDENVNIENMLKASAIYALALERLGK